MRPAVAFFLALAVAVPMAPATSVSVSSTAGDRADSAAAPDPLVQEMVNSLSRWDLYSINHQLQNISTPDRQTGTQRYMNALDFLKDHVIKNGQAGHLRVEIEPFSNQGSPLRNILVFVEGSDPAKRDERVYLSGHPDTVANAPGANDDGSGTSAAMLGCIIASRYVLNRTLVCAGWDAEEIGLVGSDRHASNASNAGVKVHGMLTMDMVGYDTEDSRQIFARDYAKSRWIGDAVVKANADYGIGLNVVQEDAAVVDARSDHVSFNKYGYHALVFRQKQVWTGNPNYHKPTDTIEKLNLQTWEMTARAALATVATLAEPTGKYGSGAVDSVKLTPPSAQLTAGQSRQFSATAFDANGNPVGATFTWGATGGSVDASGKFTSNAAGSFTVFANASGKSGTAAVTVQAATLGSIKVSPAGAVVRSGTAAQFTAEGFDTLGRPMPISPQWSVSGGSVDGSGLFTGTAAGQFEVFANQSGVSGSVPVTVTAGDAASVSISPPTATVRADGTVRFTATVTDLHGNEVPGAPKDWGALEGSVVDGLYTPNRVGVWKVEVSSGPSLSASASVTVTPGRLADIAIDPTSKELVVGARQKFSFTAVDAKNNPIPGLTGRWEVEGGVGTMDDTGSFTATAIGSGKVKLTVVSEGVTKTATADLKITTSGAGGAAGPGGGLLGGATGLLLALLVIAAVGVVAALALVARRRTRRQRTLQPKWGPAPPPQW